MGGGRTWKFDCTGNEVPVGYEELARGWSNESEKVKYCEGIILTLLVLLGITLHLNHTVNSPPGGGLFISNPFEGGCLFERGTFFNVAKMMVLVLRKELEYEVEKLKYKKLEVM